MGNGHFFHENAFGGGGGVEFFSHGFQEGVEVFGGFSFYEDGFCQLGFFVARAGGFLGVGAVGGSLFV